MKSRKEQFIELKMCKLMAEAYKRNWITAKDGNISYMTADTFFITPSGVRKHELIPEDIIKLPIKNGKILVGNQKVSIEFHLHRLIQQHQCGGAVIHFHPTDIVAAMLANINLEQIHDYFPELNRYTSVGPNVDYIFPGEHDLAINTAKNIIGNDIVGMLGHGVTSKAKELDDAFEHIERLDHCCKMALKAGAFRSL